MRVISSAKQEMKEVFAAVTILDIPYWKSLALHHLVLDVNGTLAEDGILLPGVPSRIKALRAHLDVHLISSDTQGTAKAIAQSLEVPSICLEANRPARLQKKQFIQDLGAEHVVAIGNGANDVDMLLEAALGIAVLQREGAASLAISAADVVVVSIEDALDLLLIPRRLKATLRG